jgi:hypothetical protein
MALREDSVGLRWGMAESKIEDFTVSEVKELQREKCRKCRQDKEIAALPWWQRRCHFMVEQIGFEPTTSDLQSPRSPN